MSDHDRSFASYKEDAGLYTYDSFGGSKHSPNSNFLWWCAGAHQKILKKFPSEQIKYAGLGGVVLATFVLAALSSGYAIYTVFGNWLWTIAFAIIWGFIIFNFDRFLVSTMRKYGVTKKRQVMMALPRVALAILIGITIARPLELKIFDKEIAMKMEENLHQKILRNDSLLQLENRILIQNAETERERFTNRKGAIEDSLSSLQSAYIMEADGTGGSGQRGVDRLTRLKLDAFNNANTGYQSELFSIDSNLKAQDQIISSSRSSLEDKRKSYEVSARANMGFLERNKALSDLADEEESVWWTVLMVTLLIILIEVGPILSKLIMPVGPYDIALAKEELLQMAEDENEIRQSKEIVYEKKRSFYKMQKEMSEDLTEKLSAIQKKHIDEELEKWERGEWHAKDHKASMDEVMKKIKKQYKVEEDDLL
ncbi:MAG: DUF4407 domain-containing protein [Chitinophagaceae bacterium]